MAAEMQDNGDVEAYLEKHNLAAVLNDAVNEVVRAKAPEPYASLVKLLQAKTQNPKLILGVSAREVPGPGGFPVLEAEIKLSIGTFTGTVNSGPYDNDEKRYNGKGLLKAAAAVKAVLSDQIMGLEVTNQGDIDMAISEADGAPANGVLAVSIACCIAATRILEIPLYEYISTLAHSIPRVPVPAVSLIGGGGGMVSTACFLADVVLVAEPKAKITLAQCLDNMCAVHKRLKELIQSGLDPAYNTNLKLGGEFASVTFPTVEVVKLCSSALSDSKLSDDGSLPGVLFLDVKAAAPFATAPEVSGKPYNATAYVVPPPKQPSNLTTDALSNLLVDWCTNYPVRGVTEPFSPADNKVFSKALLSKANISMADAFAKKLKAKNSEIIGESNGAPPPNLVPPTLKLGMTTTLLPTLSDVTGAASEGYANAYIMPVGTGGTVTACIQLAAKVKEIGWTLTLHAQIPGDSEASSFAADFAIGVGADTLRVGGLGSGSAARAAFSRMLKAESAGVDTRVAAQSGGSDTENPT